MAANELHSSTKQQRAGVAGVAAALVAGQLALLTLVATTHEPVGDALPRVGALTALGLIAWQLWNRGDSAPRWVTQLLLGLMPS
jgi:hypothetical protein